MLARRLPARRGRVGDGPGEDDRRRQDTAARADLPHDRAQVGPVRRRRAVGVGFRPGGQMAGLEPVHAREVGQVVMPHRADDRQAVRPRRQHREMLADPHAGDARLDRPERPADVRRCVGLRVPGVELARPPPLEDQDARLRPPEILRGRLPPRLPEAEEAVERQSSQREAPRTEGFAPRADRLRHPGASGRPALAHVSIPRRSSVTSLVHS